ncbi:unnamed protein product [Musa textilis]
MFQIFSEKTGVSVMSVKELLDFVIDASIADEDVDDYLEKIQQMVLERGETVNQDEVAPTVFVQTVDYVKKCEEDLVQMAMLQRPSLAYQLKAEEIYDQPLLGFMHTRNECNQQHRRISVEVGTEEDESTSEEDGSSFESEQEMGLEEKRAARKEHKKKVKEEKREQRKNKKLSKAEKKRRKKLAKAKCRR